MADVQLEQGYLRIANRLAEALLDAEFTGTQFKLLHTLIRLTYGWRRRTVTLSHAELAGYMHTTPSGTFRAALRELIAEGVVIQAEKGTGGRRSTYAIEKDFTKWGRFAVALGRLTRVYGQRPDSEDDALFQAELFKGDAPETGDSDSPNQAGAIARNGREQSPETGIATGANSNSGETVAPRKDRERQGKTIEIIPERAVVDGIEDAFRAAMGDQMPDVLKFLDERSPEARAHWYPELLQIIGPVTGVIPEDLAGACRDALIADPPVTSPVALRAFATRRKQERLTSVRSLVQRISSEVKGMDLDPADAAWDRVLAMMPAWHAREITEAVHKALPYPTKRALSAIGGFAVIASTAPDQITWLKKDFAKAHRAAAAPHTPAGASR